MRNVYIQSTELTSNEDINSIFDMSHHKEYSTGAIPIHIYEDTLKNMWVFFLIISEGAIPVLCRQCQLIKMHKKGKMPRYCVSVHCIRKEEDRQMKTKEFNQFDLACFK